jgi:hypothetical protein
MFLLILLILLILLFQSDGLSPKRRPDIRRTAFPAGMDHQVRQSTFKILIDLDAARS